MLKESDKCVTISVQNLTLPSLHFRFQEHGVATVPLIAYLVEPCVSARRQMPLHSLADRRVGWASCHLHVLLACSVALPGCSGYTLYRPNVSPCGTHMNISKQIHLSICTAACMFIHTGGTKFWLVGKSSSHLSDLIFTKLYVTWDGHKREWMLQALKTGWRTDWCSCHHVAIPPIRHLV